MDDISKKVVAMVNEQPSCLRDRRQLKAVLLDYLPQNKLQQNLILNAYDEDIIERLKPSTDVTLHALQIVKNLTDGYGLTKDAAIWAVTTWCKMLNLNEVADLIESTLQCGTRNANAPQDTKQYRQSFDLKATYLAGTDFPSGKIKIELDGKMQKGECTVSISKSPKRLRDLEGTWFNSQVYVSVKDGKYLAVFPWNYFGWELDFSTYKIIPMDRG